MALSLLERVKARMSKTSEVKKDKSKITYELRVGSELARRIGSNTKNALAGDASALQTAREYSESARLYIKDVLLILKAEEYEVARSMIVAMLECAILEYSQACEELGKRSGIPTETTQLLSKSNS